MKKLLKFSLILTLSFSILSCTKKQNNSKTEAPETPKTSVSDTKVKKNFAGHCSLELFKAEEGYLKPHTVVKKDLNADGTEDTFFLYGEGDSFNTCIHLKNKDNGYSLVHSSKTSYDSMFKMQGLNGYQLIAKGKEVLKCGIVEGTLPPMNDEVKNSVKNKYIMWTDGAEEFNPNYGMPDISYFLNLGIFRPVEIYTFDGMNLKKITNQVETYKVFKVNILNQVLKNKNLTEECHKSIEDLIKSI